MADTATTQDPELQDANLGQAGDSQQNDKPNPNEVKIREPFEIGGALHIIYDIEVDKKGKRTSNWRIKEGSQVEVSGSGLEIYDQINLHIAGGVYLQKNIDRQAGGRLLDFTVSDEIKDLFAEGAEIELEFVSNANPANNRYLKQKFYYKGESAEEKAEAKKKLAEEQELKQAKEGQSSPGAVSEIINRTIGGTAEAFGQGMAGKPKPPVGAVPGSTDVNKTTNQRVVSDSQADKNIDDGQDLVAEEEQQAAAGLTSTLAQSTVGAEVVGEGLTSQSSTVGTESISTGSTITGTESVSSGGTIKTSGTVSGGATTSVSGQEQAGGTVSGTQKTSVFATDTGGGTAQATQTVSGSKTISGSEKVSATGSATQKIQSEKLEASYAGILGKTIEPAIKPLGYDWKIGIALITSFAAREVFVGTMATIYSAGNTDNTQTIRDKMRAEINPQTGLPQFTVAVGFSLLLFYAFAMQCMSTLAVVYRETKNWKWPVIQFVYMGALAYFASFIVYQLLK